MALDYTPRTWTDAETVTAAELNAEIRDPFTEIQAPWNVYATATWSASGGGVDVGNGTFYGSYKQLNYTIWFHLVLTFGSTTARGTGTYFFTLPATPLFDSVGESMGGTCMIRKASPAGLTPFFPYYSSTTGNKISCIGADGSLLGATNPITLTTGDRISITGHYEVA